MEAGGSTSLGGAAGDGGTNLGGRGGIDAGAPPFAGRDARAGSGGSEATTSGNGGNPFTSAGSGGSAPTAGNPVQGTPTSDSASCGCRFESKQTRTGASLLFVALFARGRRLARGRRRRRS